jgi:hypothetical protein
MAGIPTPDEVALVRRLYSEGATIKQIAAESGITSRGVIRRCIAREYPDGVNERPAPLAPRRIVRSHRRPGSRLGLLSRMWRTAERQVEEIEHRLDAAGLELGERESNARTLAIVAKMLRELAAVEDMQSKDKAKKEAADSDIDDDPVPRNIDDFRRELARRISALVASRTDAGGGRPSSE